LLKSLQFAGPKEIDDARKRAKEMLMEQRGSPIYIITSLAVATASDYHHPTIRTVVTEGELRSYSETEIDNYIFYAEPFDKSGAFGIQEKGITLFKKMKGSYTNVVGLPLQEFVSLIQEKYKNTFRLPELRSSIANDSEYHKTELSVACVGDINYDYVYDKLPEGFFADVFSPGKKIVGPIHRTVGGTAVNFAKGARRAGFLPCYVVGMIGGDALGLEIVKELFDHEVTPIYKPDPNEKTSVAIILRDMAKEDTSITIADTHQSLPDFLVGLARDTIQKSDVFYCSGYCLADKNRYASALKMLRIAKESRQLVILDIVVGMGKEAPIKNLINSLTSEKNNSKLVDIAVSELPEIFDWFGIEAEGRTELELWELHRDRLLLSLREEFPVTILRTSRYTHEIIVTPNNVIGPVPLHYGSLPSRDKVGYGDFRTANQVHSFLSPRIVLASKSPQRFNLLSQIIAPSKIEVVASSCSEEKKAYESPYERVQRLAMKKAESVFMDGHYHDDIELIIGADTEIICVGENEGEWDMIGHPINRDEAIRDLSALNGKTHLAVTGIAVIGREPNTDKIKKFGDYVETKVTFADLSQQQIQMYAESGEPMGRAGAYAIQGLGAMLIKDLDGSYSNVVGLPLERLSEILVTEFNKSVWMFDKVSNWSFPNPIKPLAQI
jgi:septum formation protein